MSVGDYEAQIANAQKDQKTGSLYTLVKVTDSLVPPDTWFLYEVIAAGNRIRLRVNGKETADYTETRPGQRLKGHITLQSWTPTVHFRKVEIKEGSAGD